ALRAERKARDGTSAAGRASPAAGVRSPSLRRTAHRGTGSRTPTQVLARQAAEGESLDRCAACRTEPRVGLQRVERAGFDTAIAQRAGEREPGAPSFARHARHLELLCQGLIQVLGCLFEAPSP